MRGGGPLASEWHSPIGALSTRLFHNVNEKVTPIFGAARGVHVFRCLYKSTDFGGVMSSECLFYMRKCKEEVLYTGKLRRVSHTVYANTYKCGRVGNSRCCKYARRLATITLPHLTLPSSHEGSAYSAPWQYSYRPLFTGTMYPVLPKITTLEGCLNIRYLRTSSKLMSHNAIVIHPDH